MKHQDIINKMTLKDKIAMCSGKDFWHTKEMPQYEIPSLMMCDGPHGLRKQEDAAEISSTSVRILIWRVNWQPHLFRAEKKTASAPVSSILPATVRNS